MSKKTDNQTLAKLELEAAPVPFFAHLLTGQTDFNIAGPPTDWCADNICQTKKYPSDGDEPTSPTYDR